MENSAAETPDGPLISNLGLELSPVTNLQLLTDISPGELKTLIVGYESPAKLAVERARIDGGFEFRLKEVALPRPYVKRFDHLDEATIARYRAMAARGFSWGAFDGAQCVGLALAEPEEWNRSVYVRELHVAATHRKTGVGRALVEAVSAHAAKGNFRALVCETQNTNAPAIRFYLLTGFELEGFDLSLYRNTDFPDGEIALFMKRKLTNPINHE